MNCLYFTQRNTGNQFNTHSINLHHHKQQLVTNPPTPTHKANMKVFASLALASAFLASTTFAEEIILGHNGVDHRTFLTTLDPHLKSTQSHSF